MVSVDANFRARARRVLRANKNAATCAASVARVERSLAKVEGTVAKVERRVAGAA